MTDPAPPPPRHLQVEVTGACNLACPMCLVAYRPKIGRATGALSYEEYAELVEAVRPEKVTLQGLGEPLLSPHLFDMVRAAKAVGARVGFNSNGTLLTREKAERLVRLGLDWLHVSVDGGEKAYAQIRGHARRARVLSNLEGLLAIRKSLGTHRPRVIVVAVAMRATAPSLPGLAPELAAIGVDQLWVQALSHDFRDGGRDYDAIRAFVSDEQLDGDGLAVLCRETAAAADAAGLDVRLPGDGHGGAHRSAGGCDWPWEGAYVTHRGEVQPCCMVMGSDRATLGVLADDDFPAIWAGPAYRDFRERLRSRRPPSVCEGCSVYRGTF